jgi:hypothetical protein
VTGFHSPADRGTVETVDELLALDWVRVWETGHQEEDDPNRFEYYCWHGGLGRYYGSSATA